MDNEEDWMDKIKGFYNKYGEGIRRNVSAFQNNQRDCNLGGYVSHLGEVYKQANVRSPLETSSVPVNYAINKIPFIGNFNRGFNLGKLGMIAEQTYRDVCDEDDDN